VFPAIDSFVQIGKALRLDLRTPPCGDPLRDSFVLHTLLPNALDLTAHAQSASEHEPFSEHLLTTYAYPQSFPHTKKPLVNLTCLFLLYLSVYLSTLYTANANDNLQHRKLEAQVHAPPAAVSSPSHIVKWCP